MRAIGRVEMKFAGGLAPTIISSRPHADLSPARVVTLVPKRYEWEFWIYVWIVHRKRQTVASSLWLEVRSFKSFSFLDRRQISPEKINMCAAISKYTKDGGPLFETKCGWKIGF